MPHASDPAGPTDPTGPAGVDVVARHSGLVGRTVLVALTTLASRIGGFVREVLMAALFGDRSLVFDAFVTGWRVPNLFRRFLGEGALSTALQTTLTRADAEEGLAGGRALFWATMRAATVLLVVLTIVVMALVLVLPDRLPLLGWSWLGEEPAVVRELTVRMMPFVVLVCLAALTSGALNVRGHFFLPALSPVLMNVVWIGAALWVGLAFGWSPLAAPEAERARQLEMARWLALSVLGGGAVLLIAQVPGLFATRLLGVEGRRAGGALDTRAVWEVVRHTAPLAFGAAVYQVNVMVDGFMAVALLREGGATAHYLATRLQQLPMALSSVAAAAAVFPALSALGHRRAHAELRALHDRTQLGVLFLALPATAGLFALAEPIVSECLGHGEFGAEGVRRTAAALRLLALAIVPAGAVALVVRCYYALGDFATPVRVSISILAANAALNAFLLVVIGLDVEGLALSTAVTSWANLVWLWPRLARLGLPPPQAPIARRALSMLAASAGSALTARGVWELAGPGPVALGLALLASVPVYFLLARLLRLPEWVELRRRLGGGGHFSPLRGRPERPSEEGPDAEA